MSDQHSTQMHVATWSNIPYFDECYGGQERVEKRHRDCSKEQLLTDIELIYVGSFGRQENHFNSGDNSLYGNCQIALQTMQMLEMEVDGRNR